MVGYRTHGDNSIIARAAELWPEGTEYYVGTTTTPPPPTGDLAALEARVAALEVALTKCLVVEP